MRSVEERFEANVDRRGDHHRWLGTCDSHGTPQIRINGHLTTARRAAWELAHGPLSPEVTVAACEADPRCVHIEHLGLGRRRRPAPRPPAASPPRRHPRRTGSIRNVGPGLWELAVTAPDGSGRRYRRVHGNQDEATAELAAFTVELGGTATTVEALIGGYLAHLRSAARSATTLRRYQQIWRQWLAPHLGHIHPGALTRPRIEQALRDMATAGQSSSSVHQAAVILSGALAWTNDHGYVGRNPALGLQLPDGTQLAPPRHR